MACGGLVQRLIKYVYRMKFIQRLFKIVQARHGKIEVEYVNCPSSPAFWLDESDPNIVKAKYMLRSASQVASTSLQQNNSMDIIQIQDRAPIATGI